MKPKLWKHHALILENKASMNSGLSYDKMWVGDESI